MLSTKISIFARILSRKYYTVNNPIKLTKNAEEKFTEMILKNGDTLENSIIRINAERKNFIGHVCEFEILNKNEPKLIGDSLMNHNGINIAINSKSLTDIDGTCLDYKKRKIVSEFVFKGPITID